MKAKKLLVALSMLGLTSTVAFGQLQDQKDVTFTMDLQPILQLNMTTPSQIDFTFDDINSYYAGITRYGATILKVSSTVNWDLYAVGRSNGNTGAGFWDQQIRYGTAAAGGETNQLPLSALELRQNTPNAATGGTGTFEDYSAAFPAVASPNGANSLYVDPANSNTPPLITHKYIAGHKGTTAVGTDGIAGGSYLTSNGLTSNYFYSIDYRILPGLPAIFPMAFAADGTTAQDLVTINGAGSFAQPGVYTMYVQYILLEDQ
jgi:type II secretory pathway pseudopilin PulG